ncbi:hypothetical protein SAMD00019534_082230 [Acytostelium subglobosum LB1]|uniref:hypothetical protein n=1 Tax=Acytostelium subglobosum LB1 TaxID=1410327 RepID=UPI0006448E3E|nr:hypothetical protein SAMD00019534_082230 [Acytostelium subglobosum LB1]GAM25048.1 hypothetical protein SAMD00019534_082230 [Acytostelium subglobosum LB1]|eukprot:XP_012752137.1 hypothetical protein SAMD00019534_082230 [Acytostelium subglobosum LB1]
MVLLNSNTIDKSRRRPCGRISFSALVLIVRLYVWMANVGQSHVDLVLEVLVILLVLGAQCIHVEKRDE